MARYDYRCPSCHHVFEVEHGMNEKPKVVCPVCGTEASRVFEATGITLKGSGFYNTDMRDGKGSASAPHGSSDATSAKDGASGSAGEGASSAESAATSPSSAGESAPSPTPSDANA